METSIDNDKRAYKRFINREPVRVQFLDSEDSSGCLGYDVSEGGVKFLYNEFIPLGKELRLEVVLSNKEVVHCTGRVVWVQQIPHSYRYQVGIQFEDDSLIYDARSRIHSFFKETHSNN